MWKCEAGYPACDDEMEEYKQARRIMILNSLDFDFESFNDYL